MCGSSETERIQEYVKALADCAGVDPCQLIFKWEELQGLQRPGDDGRADQKVQTVRVFLDKRWSTLVFTDSEMMSLKRTPEQVFADHKGDVLETLRRLRGLSNPIPESACPDRWIAEGDSFPGESV